MAKEHGQGSHFFRNLLEVTFSAHMLIPHDIKNTVNFLLSPAEYMLWERHWKKNLKILSDTYSKDTGQPNLTVEQLAGEGELQKPNDQVNTIPEATLQDISIAAKTSLLLTPDDSIPTLHFANIKQGVDESFITVISQL